MDNFAVPPLCFTVFKLFDSVKGQHSRIARTDMSTDALKMLGYAYTYTGCNRRNGPDFGRVFLMLNYTEKPQNTYVQS